MSQNRNQNQSGLDRSRLTQVHSRPTDEDPVLSIRPSRDGYISKLADKRFFKPAEEVVPYVDEERDLLALEPVEDTTGLEPGDTLSLQREYNSGANISLKGALRLLGADSDIALESSEHVRLEERGEFVVADLSEFLEKVGARSNPQIPTTPHGADAPPAQQGPGAREADADPPAAVERNERLGDDSVDYEEIATRVRTLESFAEEIGESVGRARTVAMDRGVYSDLHDRPGAYRGGVEP